MEHQEEIIERILDLEELVTDLTDMQFRQLADTMRQHGFQLESRESNGHRVIWIEAPRS